MKSSLGAFQPAKGVLMLMIIISHTALIFWPAPQSSPQVISLSSAFFLLSDFCRYAAMPCFFMICGYGFRRRRLHILMRNIVAPIARAYLITSLLIIGITTIRAMIQGRGVLQTLIVQSLTYALMATPPLELFGFTTYSIGTIWFPCVMALASLVLNQVLVLKERRWQAFVCAVLACAGVLLRTANLPFCILQTCVCVSYMYIGYLMRQEKLLAKGMPWHLVGLSLIVYLCLHVMDDHQIAIAYNWYPHGLMDVAFTWLLGYVAMYFAAALDEVEGKLVDMLCWVGRHSFMICCIHHVDKNALPLQRMMTHLIPHNALLGFSSLLLLRMFLYITIISFFLRYGKRWRSRT